MSRPEHTQSWRATLRHRNVRSSLGHCGHAQCCARLALVPEFVDGDHRVGVRRVGFRSPVAERAVSMRPARSSESRSKRYPFTSVSAFGSHDSSTEAGVRTALRPSGASGEKVSRGVTSRAGEGGPVIHPACDRRYGRSRYRYVRPFNGPVHKGLCAEAPKRRELAFLSFARSIAYSSACSEAIQNSATPFGTAERPDHCGSARRCRGCSLTWFEYPASRPAGLDAVRTRTVSWSSPQSARGVLSTIRVSRFPAREFRRTESPDVAAILVDRLGSQRIRESRDINSPEVKTANLARQSSLGRQQRPGPLDSDLSPRSATRPGR